MLVVEAGKTRSISFRNLSNVVGTGLNTAKKEKIALTIVEKKTIVAIIFKKEEMLTNKE